MFRRFVCFLGLHKTDRCYDAAGDFSSCRYCEWTSDY